MKNHHSVVLRAESAAEKYSWLTRLLAASGSPLAARGKTPQQGSKPPSPEQPKVQPPGPLQLCLSLAQLCRRFFPLLSALQGVTDADVRHCLESCFRHDCHYQKLHATCTATYCVTRKLLEWSQMTGLCQSSPSCNFDMYGKFGVPGRASEYMERMQ